MFAIGPEEKAFGVHGLADEMPEKLEMTKSLGSAGVDSLAPSPRGGTIISASY